VLGGSDAPAIDAEVIEMVMTFFDRLGLQGVQLDINSIGDRNCRPKYVELLRAELLKVKDKLGADSQRRIETNPLRVLDSKLESEQGIIATLPRIADHLCDDCKTHYAAVKHQLEMRGVIYRENWRLVRGLDYYMRTTFEVTAQDWARKMRCAAAGATMAGRIAWRAADEGHRLCHRGRPPDFVVAGKRESSRAARPRRIYCLDG